MKCNTNCIFYIFTIFKILIPLGYPGYDCKFFEICSILSICKK